MACCAAYFMAKYEWGLEKAFTFVQSKCMGAHQRLNRRHRLRILRVVFESG